MKDVPRPAVHALMLLFVLTGALGLRALRCQEGLPYLHEWDEPQTASTALRILQTGDFNPRFFNYGSFMIYAHVAVDAAHYLAPPALAGLQRPEALHEIVTEHDTGWHWTISHPSFILWNRYLVALMGLATVVLVYLIGSALGGPWAGLTAAAFLGALEFHVYHSSIVTPNAPVAMLVTLACYAALRHLEGRGAGFLLASFAVCGLAISTKYNAALALLLPWGALWLARGRPGAGWWTRRRLILAGLFLPPLVFLLTTPYAALDLPAFLRAAGGEVRHYFIKGQGPATIEPGWPHAWLQLTTLHSTAGTILSVAALAGTAALIRRRSGALLLGFAATYFIYMTRSRISEHRNFVMLYPFVAVAVGVGAVAIAAWLSRLPPSKPLLRRAALICLVVATVAALSMQAAASSARSWRAATVGETRSRVIDLVNSLLAGTPRGDTRVGIASELKIHQEDLARLAAPAEVAPYEELCRTGSGRYAIVVGASSYRHDLPEDEERARRMNSLQPAGMSFRERIGDGRWTHLTFFSINPGIVVYAGS